MTCCTAAGPVENVWREIVGVAADVRQANLDEEPAARCTGRTTQIVEHDMFLMVRARSSSDAARLATHSDRSCSPWIPTRSGRTCVRCSDVINGSDSIRLRRFVLILLGSFAGLAVLLAAVGTYGVMAYSVADRTREIGIRVALGATRSMVLNQVLSETMKLTLGGLVIGALAAQVLTRFISSMLFGVTSTDAADLSRRVVRARRRRAAGQLSPCPAGYADRSSRGAAARVSHCSRCSMVRRRKTCASGLD